MTARCICFFLAWAPLAFADFINVFKDCTKTCSDRHTICEVSQFAGCVGVFESCKIHCYQMATREGAWDNKQCHEVCAAEQITCTAEGMLPVRDKSGVGGCFDIYLSCTNVMSQHVKVAARWEGKSFRSSSILEDHSCTASRFNVQPNQERRDCLKCLVGIRHGVKGYVQ